MCFTEFYTQLIKLILKILYLSNFKGILVGETKIVSGGLGVEYHSLEHFNQQAGLLYRKDWKADSLSAFLWGTDGWRVRLLSFLSTSTATTPIQTTVILHVGSPVLTQLILLQFFLKNHLFSSHSQLKHVALPHTLTHSLASSALIIFVLFSDHIGPATFVSCPSSTTLSLLYTSERHTFYSFHVS